MRQVGDHDQQPGLAAACPVRKGTSDQCDGLGLPHHLISSGQNDPQFKPRLSCFLGFPWAHHRALLRSKKHVRGGGGGGGRGGQLATHPELETLHPKP